MTIAEFATVTKRVIAREGFDHYLPTAVYPERAEVLVLEGVPPHEDLEVIAVKWASGLAKDDEEFLVAFKHGPNQFKVVRRQAALEEQAVFDINTGG